MENSANLMAHTLSAINLADVRRLDKVRLDKEAYEARASAADTFYNSFMEDKLIVMTQLQLVAMAKEATNDEQLQFVRGVIYGLGLVNEWFIEQRGVVASRGDKKADTSIEKI